MDINFNRRLGNLVNDDEECIVCPHCKSKNLLEEIKKQIENQQGKIIKFVKCCICEKLWIPKQMNIK